MYGWEQTLLFMRRLATMCLLGLLAICATAMTQRNEVPEDTVRHLDEVVVTSKLTFREVIPSQKLSGEQLERLNAQSFPGENCYSVQVVR